MADVLEQFLSGGKNTTQNAPSVISDALLDRLKKVESGGDPFALNKESKAMGAYQFMPEQVQNMHKQGIEFNPFNEQQSRLAAKTYLEKLVKEKGSVEKALAAYGGFVTKDPSAYVNKVMQEPTTTTTAAATPTFANVTPAPGVTADPLEAFFSGQAPQAAPVAPIGQSKSTELIAPNGDAKLSVEPMKEGGTAVGRAAGRLLGQVQQGKRGLGERIAGAVDTLYGVVPAVYGAGVQALARTANTPEEAERIGQQAAATIDRPLGKALGITGKETYQQPLGGVTQPIAEQVNKMFNVLGMTPEQISEKTGIAAADIRNMVVIGSMALPSAIKEVAPVAKQATQAIVNPVKEMAAELQIAKAQPTPKQAIAAIAGEQESHRRSVGSAAVPDATTIEQALSVATPELQAALKGKNLDTSFIRHLEADSLPVPIRLTEGQSTGDIIKISNEQNRRAKDPELAQRFNQQNKQLIENIDEIRKNAAPDVYGTKTIENSQGIIDAYKSMDAVLNKDIDAKYKALRDANGGQFPVDAPKLLQNIERKLQRELLSNDVPKGQFRELERLARDNNMTFEDYLSLRRNLGDIAKTGKNGQERMAANFMIEQLEKLPLQEGARRLKPIADIARDAARNRFIMFEKDPAFKAAVNDSVAADKFIDKFVINGVHKNINTMVQHLGKNTPAHQQMAAGTINWLRDKSGVTQENSNFSQKQYNSALKKLDDVNNLHEIFNPETASQLKTLGNVANYTQFQPRGSFVNNSNTLVGAMAQQASKAIGKGVETGLNVAVPGLQLGTSVMETRARHALEAESRKALELGAGTQTGKNKLKDLNK